MLILKVLCHITSIILSMKENIYKVKEIKHYFNKKICVSPAVFSALVNDTVHGLLIKKAF